MNRNILLKRLQSEPSWDVVVVGGGATGLGVAVDAASRGYRTLLVEQADFSKGTSSRSTKLVHGGVRYLKQGNISLVLEALAERGLLCENAPHLVHHQEFIVPIYHWWEGPFYGVGLKLYDQLAGKLGLGPSQYLSKEEVLQRIPVLEPEGLKGGVRYYDGQFDDARLAIHLAATAADLGAVVLNYTRCVDFKKQDGMIQGITLEDTLNGTRLEVKARAVINATGVFSDALRKMDDPKVSSVIQASQGIHLVLPREFLGGNSAIMVPQTSDGRVLFAVPWHDHVVVGTTDTPVNSIDLEPVAMEEEIDFILENAGRYLTKDPVRNDILSIFAGLRPLVKAAHGSSDTAALSRDHSVLISESGLITVAGGKWTTYRKMAEDVVDQAELVAGWEPRKCETRNLHIHGWTRQTPPRKELEGYGKDAREIMELEQQHPEWQERLHAQLPYSLAEVVYAVRSEMAMTVEDVLCRRTRAIFLNATAAAESAGKVADIMAQELDWNETEKNAQLTAFQNLAEKYGARKTTPVSAQKKI